MESGGVSFYQKKYEDLSFHLLILDSWCKTPNSKYKSKID